MIRPFALLFTAFAGRCLVFSSERVNLVELFFKVRSNCFCGKRFMHMWLSELWRIPIYVLMVFPSYVLYLFKSGIFDRLSFCFILDHRF